MALRETLVFATVLTAITACASSSDPAEEAGSGTDTSALSGCSGHASSSVPASGDYYLTTFGGGSDTQGMACGGRIADGKWYYAASKQRFGCGAHVRIEAKGKCVVAETNDYGPDVCVEKAAGRPVLDASPMVAKALFGTSGAGWSDHYAIHVTEVPKSTPLGPCAPAAVPQRAPRGQLDAVDCTSIKGWAQDPDKPTSAIGVTITIDGPLGQAGVTKLGSTAGTSRADLCKPLGSCGHAFDVKLPPALADGKPHAIYAYGVDTASASRTTLLANAPKTITCAPGTAPQDPEDDAGAPASAPSSVEPTGSTSEAEDPPPTSDAHHALVPAATGGCATAPRAASVYGAALVLAIAALFLGARRTRRRSPTR